MCRGCKLIGQGGLSSSSADLSRSSSRPCCPRSLLSGHEVQKFHEISLLFQRTSRLIDPKALRLAFNYKGSLLLSLSCADDGPDEFFACLAMQCSYVSRKYTHVRSAYTDALKSSFCPVELPSREPRNPIGYCVSDFCHCSGGCGYL